MRCANDEKLDNFLYKWFIEKSSEGVPISGIMIQQKAPKFNSKLGGSKEFQASSGWLEKFKNRQLSIVGEKLSSDIEAGNSFIAEWQDLIAKEELTADQIYNCDETGLYWRALPTKTLAAENEAVAPGRKKMTDRVTILGCANACGSHRVELTLVGKSKKSRCFKNINKTSLPVHYMHQESARMNSSLFSEWFHDCFVPELKKNLRKLKLKKAILLMDNAPAHPDVEENITCIFMPPNTTAILQPMDQGVIESMKRRYRKQLLSKLLFGGDGDEKEAACSIVQFRKALTLKDCVYMINEASESVPEYT
ncbi:Jerky -like [Araneus ventricosus]|uniref:Jerky-like n=1 Tax=Araneus ventricosus TaxID=182803 RepID=A0A4Y2I456_ARAVE|nr:Jerky -like [Araneus ventricosus]